MDFFKLEAASGAPAVALAKGVKPAAQVAQGSFAKLAGRLERTADEADFQRF